MDFLNSLGLFLQVSVQTGTHILFGILGGILFEKAGNSNLGTEGMMLLGAAFGYLAGMVTGNPVLAVLAAGFAGSLGALIYAVIAITLRGNQIVTGLVLTTFGTGVASYMGKTLSANPLPDSVTVPFTHKAIPLLSKIPVIGPMLFDQSTSVQSAKTQPQPILLELTLVCINIFTFLQADSCADLVELIFRLYLFLAGRKTLPQVPDGLPLPL